MIRDLVIISLINHCTFELQIPHKYLVQVAILFVSHCWVFKSRNKFHPHQLLVYLRELLVEVPAYYDLGLFVLS
jgi:hypothetical protein